MLNLKQTRNVGRSDADVVSLDREPAVALTVAEQLKISRERAGLALDEVSAFLKIRQVHLEALEDGRNDDLPGHTYAVGFVRAYSEFLGLDKEVIVARFKDETAELEAKTRLVFPSPMPEGQTPAGAIILIAVVCAAIVYGAWIYMSSQDRSLAEIVPSLPDSLLALISFDSVVEAPKPTPAPTPSSTSAAPPSTQSNDPVKIKTSPVPVTSTATSERTAEAVSAIPAIVAPETAPDSDTAIVPAPVTSETPAATPAVAPAATPAATPLATLKVAETPGQDAPVVTSAEVPAKALSAADAGQPSNVGVVAIPESIIPEKVARILDSIEIPPPATPPATPKNDEASNNISTNNASEKVTTAAIVMPPTPPQEDTSGPRQFGIDNVASRITIFAKIDSWVEVRDSDGSLLLTRVLKTGDSYKVPNRAGLKLHTGNAGGLRFEIDGLRAPEIGPIGAVRRDVALDVDALKAGDANN